MTKQTCWIVDGQPFLTVEAAQQASLEKLLLACLGGSLSEENRATAAKSLIGAKDEIVNCLTMKASSHPKARAAAGATRKPHATKATAPATGGAAA